jgi:hypothetical protein
VRTDTGDAVGKIVTNRYTLFTHRQAVEKTQAFIDQFGGSKSVSYLEKGGARFIQEHTFNHHTLEVKGTRAVGDVVHLRAAITNSYGMRSAVSVKLCAMVLRCLNGMTIPGGEIELSFRHTGQLTDLELPHPDVVVSLFNQSGETWKEWAERDVTPEQQEFIGQNALKTQVLSKKTYSDYEELLEPGQGRTFWSYYNNFTNVLTHKIPRVQHSSRLGRMDRLNSIFKAVASGQTELAG